MTSEEESGTLTFPIITAESPVVRWNETSREVRLLSLQASAFSDSDQNFADNSFGYWTAATYLAYKHFNERSDVVIKDLPDRLKGCDVFFSLEMRDTHFSLREGVSELLQVNLRGHTLEHPLPFAFVGAVQSAVSEQLAILSAAWGIPQISAASTSEDLEDRNRYPLFSRVVPSNRRDAEALCLYLKSIDVKLVGILFGRDTYGNSFHQDLTEILTGHHITTVSAPYDVGADVTSEVTLAGLAGAVSRLVERDTRYVIAIPSVPTLDLAIEEAFRAGILGREGYQWFFTDSAIKLRSDGYRVPNEDSDIAQAIHGLGSIVIDVPPNDSFDSALREFETNRELQREVAASFLSTSAFEEFDWRWPGTDFYAQLAYDAVMSLGIAACSIEEDMFTRQQVRQSLLTTTFEGASGFVSFDPMTGTRLPTGLKYRIMNTRVSDTMSTDDYVSFFTNTTHQVELQGDTSTVTELIPFLGSANSSLPPLSIPPVEEEMNLVPPPILATGLTIGGIAILLSIGNFVWTVTNRKVQVVRIAQPFFLCQICLGTLILSLAVVPMSFQEPMNKSVLDRACRTTPWLISIGFVTAFSALLSKTWRLNKLFSHGTQCRRVLVRRKDVLYPLIILLFLNTVLLSLWTALAPLKWTRVYEGNYDEFGRAVESYGTCFDVKGSTQWMFVALIAAVNVAALVLANFQSYKARTVPTLFNESLYVALANVSLLEALLLAGPILVLSHKHPSARFMVFTLLIAIVVFAIQLSMFLPKHLVLQSDRVRQRSAPRRLFSTPLKRHTRGGGVPDETGWSEERSDFVSGMMTVTRKRAYFEQRNMQACDKQCAEK